MLSEAIRLIGRGESKVEVVATRRTRNLSSVARASMVQRRGTYNGTLENILQNARFDCISGQEPLACLSCVRNSSKNRSLVRHGLPVVSDDSVTVTKK